MTAGRIVLVRHGETDYNREARVQGNIDIPLNETGRAQAARCAELLPRYLSGRTVGRIVASPLSRAADTAVALGAALGVDPVADGRLRERAFGEFEGLNRAELEEYRAEEYRLWMADEPPEEMGVEPKLDVVARVSEAVLEHAEELGPEETLVAVGHGSSTGLLIASLIGLDPERGWPLRGLENCHWSELAHQADRDPVWQLRHHNVGAGLLGD